MSSAFFVRIRFYERLRTCGGSCGAIGSEKRASFSKTLGTVQTMQLWDWRILKSQDGRTRNAFWCAFMEKSLKTLCLTFAPPGRAIAKDKTPAGIMSEELMLAPKRPKYSGDIAISQSRNYRAAKLRN